LPQRTTRSLVYRIGCCSRIASRRAYTLARLGGDEFVLVLHEIAGPRDAESVASKVALHNG